MKAQLGPTKAQLAQAATIINVSLTVRERDELDAARGRLRQLVVLLPLIDTDSALVDSDEAMAIIGELGEIMRECIDRLDAVFVSADERRGTGGAS